MTDEEYRDQFAARVAARLVSFDHSDEKNYELMLFAFRTADAAVRARRASPHRAVTPSEPAPAHGRKRR